MDPSVVSAELPVDAPPNAFYRSSRRLSAYGEPAPAKAFRVAVAQALNADSEKQVIPEMIEIQRVQPAPSFTGEGALGSIVQFSIKVVDVTAGRFPSKTEIEIALAETKRNGEMRQLLFDYNLVTEGGEFAVEFLPPPSPSAEPEPTAPISPTNANSGAENSSSLSPTIGLGVLGAFIILGGVVYRRRTVATPEAPATTVHGKAKLKPVEMV
jgi:hypothetical protein